MKSKLLALIALVILTSCDDETPKQNGRSSEMEYTPDGAVFLKDYGNSWTLWKLEGSCILSRRLLYNDAVLTHVPCPGEGLPQDTVGYGEYKRLKEKFHEK